MDVDHAEDDASDSMSIDESPQTAYRVLRTSTSVERLRGGSSFHAVGSESRPARPRSNSFTTPRTGCSNTFTFLPAVLLDSVPRAQPEPPTAAPANHSVLSTSMEVEAFLERCPAPRCPGDADCWASPPIPAWLMPNPTIPQTLPAPPIVQVTPPSDEGGATISEPTLRQVDSNMPTGPDTHGTRSRTTSVSSRYQRINVVSSVGNGSSFGMFSIDAGSSRS